MKVLKNLISAVKGRKLLIGCLTLASAVAQAQNPDAIMPEPNAPGLAPNKGNDVKEPPLLPPPGMDNSLPPQGPPPGSFPDSSDPRKRGPAGAPEGFRMPPPPTSVDDALPERNIQGRRRPERREPPQRPSRGVKSRGGDEGILDVKPTACVKATGKFFWNFENEDVEKILSQVSSLTCRTIIVHDSIKSTKMTIIGQTPITADDAWDILLASLQAKGLALVQQGKAWTVIKRSESAGTPTPLYTSADQAKNNEGVGTLFYRTQNAPQDVLVNIAKKLKSKEGLVEPVGDQFIIMVDSNSNIKRFGELLGQVDVEDALNKVHVIPLNNADAKTVEKQLRDLFDISAGSGRARRKAPGPTPGKGSSLNISTLISDDRINSLIVVTDKESLDKLKEVVALIDQPSTDQANKGKIHVKKLKFADAKKVAETLTAVVQGGKGGGRFGRRRDDGSGDLFEGDVKVTAHESNNAVVIAASMKDLPPVLKVINELDQRREQVYVEAAILDIQVSDHNEFGVNLFAGVPGPSGGLGIVGNPGGRGMVGGLKTALEKAGTAGLSAANTGGVGIGALAVLGNFLQGGVVGFSGPNISNTEIPSFGAVLQALSTNSNVDVLSTPHVLTSDNQEAEMSVGEKIPVIRGASTMGGSGSGGLGIPIQNVQYEDVKLTFKITPRVGADDNVSLTISQEVNELGQKEEILNQTQYRIRTKTAKTTLVLKDQQTGVIGGLMQHRNSKLDNKVPFLGDIPILGWLFKNRAMDQDKRSLLLVITPYVIRTDADYKKIMDRKLKEREEFARLYYGGKIKEYNKYIDYDKKAGPLSSMLSAVDAEMAKAENGGSEAGHETVITPKTEPKTPTELPTPNVDADIKPDTGAELLQDVPSDNMAQGDLFKDSNEGAVSDFSPMPSE